MFHFHLDKDRAQREKKTMPLMGSGKSVEGQAVKGQGKSVKGQAVNGQGKSVKGQAVKGQGSATTPPSVLAKKTLVSASFSELKWKYGLTEFEMFDANGNIRIPEGDNLYDKHGNITL